MKTNWIKAMAAGGIMAAASQAMAAYGVEYTLMPQFAQDSVVKTNSDGNYNSVSNVDYEIYTAMDGLWHVYRQANNDDAYSGNDTWQIITDNYQSVLSTSPRAGAPWYAQAVEFDNAGGVAHNPDGNLLVCNFGNGYTGLEIYAVSTNGTGDAWASIWSAHCEGGGDYGKSSGPAYSSALSQRGGGLSVSPFNDKLAWISNDTGTLWVLDYYDGGAAAGTGVAQLGQSPVADAGVWAGNPRVSGAIAGGQVGKTGSTQGTCWLNNHTVAVFNAYGEIVTADVSKVAGGTNKGAPSGDRTNQALANMVPTVFTGWTVSNSETSTASQFTDIEYNPAIDPTHIYASETRSSGYAGYLYKYSYDPAVGPTSITLVSSWLLPNAGGKAVEPREIGLDSQGNLWIACFRSGSTGQSAVKINNIVANFGNNSAVVQSNAGSHYGAYTGLDVASATDVKFDINGDGVVDGSDLNLLLSNFDGVVHQDATTGYTVDLNNDGAVDGSDMNLLLTDFEE